jgi:hypothetical protein
MRCAKCGGLIHLDEDCPECGIGYREMLEGISHEEMRRLFKKIDELECECRCIDLEASLMACELENSSLILPASMDEDNMGFVQLPGPNNRQYIALCTDMDEFRKCFDELTPLTNSWKQQLTLLEGGADGFVINPMGEVCFLEMEFLKQYFLDDE